MSVRIPTDSSRKSFFMTRANVVTSLVELFGMTADDARNTESQVIYKEGHDCVENYKDIAIEYFSAYRDDREPFVYPVARQQQKTTKVSEKILQGFFEVKMDDIVTGKAVMSRCGECKSTEVFSTAVQTRSADEGMTLMNRCERCGHSWKE